MLAKQGTYLGRGVPQRIVCGFRPDLVIIKADSQIAYFHHRYMWEGKTHAFGDDIAAVDRVILTDDGFTLATNADVNGAGTTFHYLALADNESGQVSCFAYCGKDEADRVLSGFMDQKPAALIIKRDRAVHGQIKTSLQSGAATKGFDASLEADLITLNDGGSFTVANDSRVNELGNIFGEASDCVAFFDGPGVQVIEYTGTGAERTITTTIADPKLVMVIPTTATAVQFYMPTMDTDSADPFATALASDRITAAAANQVTLGTDDTVNESGETFYLLVVGKTSTKKISSQRITYVSGVRNQFVSNVSANRGGIDCGSSDTTLKIDGAITLELDFRPYALGVVSQAIGLLMRAGATYGGTATAGDFSWALSYRRNFGGLNVCCTNYMDFNDTDTDFRTRWRTGLRLFDGTRYHIVVTHDGNGLWKLYVDGKLKKVRDYDMTAHGAGFPNIESGAGHKTAIFARPGNSGALVEQCMGELYSARVYSRELTAAEAEARYRYSVLGIGSDVTTGLAEAWAETTGTTTTLPASQNSNNNGTTQGSVERLGWFDRS